jgi:hypothetical protein
LADAIDPVHFITFVDGIIGIQITVPSELDMDKIQEWAVVRESRLHIVQGEADDVRSGIPAKEIFSCHDIPFAYGTADHHIKEDLFAGIQERVVTVIVHPYNFPFAGSERIDIPRIHFIMIVTLINENVFAVEDLLLHIPGPGPSVRGGKQLAGYKILGCEINPTAFYLGVRQGEGQTTPRQREEMQISHIRQECPDKVTIIFLFCQWNERVMVTLTKGSILLLQV